MSEIQGCGRIGGRLRAERTKNIQLMSVTLDVSKLTGWLKSGVPCRESKQGNTARSGMPEIQGIRR
eukprot:scaffold3455_cov62-Phaeocystis_antarctica.AAC.10